MRDSVDAILAQWRAERPDLDPSPMGVIGRISRAARALERRLRDHFASRGLQSGEFDILATLRRSGAPYRLSAGALVGSAMVTSGAITHRLDRLVAKDLVTRETDPDHRRSVLVTLTDHGRELVDELVDAHLELERALLADLDTAEQDQLAGLLRTLLNGLGDTPE
ncbi:MarR family transcriptional regulator [Saccharomonospora piscinae]|uniref:MarR family transcriptional regulator n=1 Tax=Saccharomonospora piscinae TaxID=687388 RepID=A0A1V9AE52_SACPI|nr:MarR family transcriptional regulator [Saccharomonospora piscinae]TLW90504.1 MarR family transcriptional regulator [Saccharomonospora piscinae]